MSVVPVFGFTSLIALAFLIGLALLLFGLFHKKNKGLRLGLLVAGGVLLALSLAACLLLIFVFIPAM
ncbi:MAG: hypothetical protein LBU47_05820 [Christensenellaceae bacterium]|jgi:hypothetical protein|nr:hypothetical protein [Christensenellaceae bacterium]